MLVHESLSLLFIHIFFGFHSLIISICHFRFGIWGKFTLLLKCRGRFNIEEEILRGNVENKWRYGKGRF